MKARAAIADDGKDRRWQPHHAGEDREELISLAEEQRGACDRPGHSPGSHGLLSLPAAPQIAVPAVLMRIHHADMDELAHAGGLCGRHDVARTLGVDPLERLATPRHKYSRQMDDNDGPLQPP